MLRGKVAVVTGAGRGIGAAIARALAGAGAAVAVNYLKDRERAEQVCSAIGAAGGRAILVQADVTRPDEAAALVRRAEAELGPVDILVNNASIRFPVAPFAAYRWEDFERKLTGELRASFSCCQAVAPGMIERRRGCIVNVGSGLSRVPGPGFVAHTTAKAALDGFSKALALELGPHGIRVNVVAPGLTLTDATRDQPKQFHEAAAARAPLRRIAEPDDVAGAVLFFCSEQARFVTGAWLPVNGGAQMV